ncbi:hypothetical protein Syun_028095 [Stephania yunnanensis]|uniref:Uncharacterized protein n=1 Tax=Stephania yunnanensis TaxID=152371 RepID=A0AAP0EH44_9MAGN
MQGVEKAWRPKKRCTTFDAVATLLANAHGTGYLYMGAESTIRRKYTHKVDPVAKL